MLKGSKMSDEAKARMRAGWALRRELGLPGSRLGLRHSADTRSIISERTKSATQRGESHYAWKGGTKVKRQGDRGTPEYRAWRLAVFSRDAFTCLICTVYTGGGNLEAHHCKSYAEFPELRFDVDNGVTLCNYHHQREIHDRG